MDTPSDAKTGQNQTTASKAPGADDEAAGGEAKHAERVSAEIRITPLSLLFSSALGASTFTVLLVGGVLVLPTGSVSSESVASLLSSFGPELLLAFAVLLSVFFLVGYRRHGRPVPTEAWASEDVLVVQVPAAWGTLIREELRVEEPRLEEARREMSRPEKHSGPTQGETTRSDGPSGEGLLVKGTAREWWDPGVYEVRVGTKAAGVLEPELAGNSEGRFSR